MQFVQRGLLSSLFGSSSPEYTPPLSPLDEKSVAKLREVQPDEEGEVEALVGRLRAARPQGR